MAEARIMSSWPLVDRQDWCMEYLPPGPMEATAERRCGNCRAAEPAQDGSMVCRRRAPTVRFVTIADTRSAATPAVSR